MMDINDIKKLIDNVVQRPFSVVIQRSQQITAM
jgi:hypothetical protein